MYQRWKTSQFWVLKFHGPLSWPEALSAHNLDLSRFLDLSILRLWPFSVRFKKSSYPSKRFILAYTCKNRIRHCIWSSWGIGLVRYKELEHKHSWGKYDPEDNLNWTNIEKKVGISLFDKTRKENQLKEIEFYMIGNAFRIHLETSTYFSLLWVFLTISWEAILTCRACEIWSIRRSFAWLIAEFDLPKWKTLTSLINYE